MKFGLIVSQSVPKPWEPGNEARSFWDDVERCVAADEAGWDYVWAPEHHFLEEYSHGSSSDMFLMAVAPRTSRIRLVTGIVNICPAINHPIRVAERMAILDIFSNGRLDVGTGRGSGSCEVNGFGLTNDVTKDMWAEAIEAIPKMWTSTDFSWDGKYFSMPERNVLPKPVQDPHPPLWVTAGNPSTAAIAGQKGLGLAMFTSPTPEAVAEPIGAYRAALENSTPVGSFVNDQVMVVNIGWCLEDAEEALEKFRADASNRQPHITILFDTIPFAGRPDAGGGPVPQSVYREWIAQAKHGARMLPGAAAAGRDVTAEMFDPARATPEELEERGICVGDPDHVIRVIKRYEAAGVNQIAFSVAAGLMTAPQEKVLEVIRTIGEKVIPHFRETPVGSRHD
jgi:alkanesulfonate monooxygenase SsuD/methylene tetrahydromethanopterin reductase-like flavin-dependent oxidoreductase (luciferase family)